MPKKPIIAETVSVVITPAVVVIQIPNSTKLIEAKTQIKSPIEKYRTNALLGIGFRDAHIKWSPFTINPIPKINIIVLGAGMSALKNVITIAGMIRKIEPNTIQLIAFAFITWFSVVIILPLCILS